MRISRKPLLVLALVGMAFAVPALAQQPSVYPAACDASKVTRQDVDRAHTVFLSGKGFLDEANYDKAISYFKDAYSIDCSVHAILPIIATAYERKGDKGEAIHALGEYLTRVPNAPDREVIERRIRNLRDQLAAEHPTATAPATAPTSTIATAPTSTVPVEPTATSTSTVPSATTAPTGAPPEGGHTVAPWILTIGGGVLVVAGGVMLGVGSGDVSTANKACPSHVNCDSSVASNGNTGRTLETAGVVVGGVGIAAVVGGLVWHFTEHPQGSGTALAPVVAPGYGGLSLGGSF
ncbi:MAG TPA: hypothetical protein VGG39_29445 [Polyangiaceae bacterium]|jgi:hypothetical protein